MRMLGAQVMPWSVEYDEPTRKPAASGPSVSFQPANMVPERLMTIVGSTWYLYGELPSVTLTFGKNGISAFGRGCALGTTVPERCGAAAAFPGIEIAIADASTSTTRTNEKPLTPLPATRLK